MATLEFSALFPKVSQGGSAYRYEQWLEFSKASPDEYPDPTDPKKTITIHDKMKLHGRDGHGVWEPKVSNGYGYTVSAAEPYTGAGPPAPPGENVGIPPAFNVGLTDALLPTDADHKVVKPFHVRLAVCFTGKDGKHPQPKSDIRKMFQVTRGYKAYGSPTGNDATLIAKDVWKPIKECFNLDSQNAGNVTGCPAKGIAVGGQCPDGQSPVDNRCPTKGLAPAATLDAWQKDNESWYYDKDTGYLYLHLVQKVDNGNPKGPLSSPSPTGSCDPAKSPLPPECPNANAASPENYYFCPAGGCIAYGVKLESGEVAGTYDPGKSNCDPLSWKAPTDSNLLTDAKGTVLDRDPKVAKPKLANPSDIFPHYALKGGDEATMCPNRNSTPQPPWGPYPDDAPQMRSFQVEFPSTMTVTVGASNWDGVNQGLYSAGNLIVWSLQKGESYNLVVSDPKTKKECKAKFTPGGTRDQPEFTRQQDSGTCIPQTGGGKIRVSAPQ
jgi:hypothetical protein